MRFRVAYGFQTLAVILALFASGAAAQAPAWGGALSDRFGRPLAYVLIGADQNLRLAMEKADPRGIFNHAALATDLSRADVAFILLNGWEQIRNVPQIARYFDDLDSVAARGEAHVMEVVDLGAPAEDGSDRIDLKKRIVVVNAPSLAVLDARCVTRIFAIYGGYAAPPSLTEATPEPLKGCL